MGKPAMRLKVIKIDTGQEIKNKDLLMAYAEMDRPGFESIGAQADGQPIVCDKHGNFSYLDRNIYRVDIEL